MSTRQYEIIGEHSAPEDFKNYMYRTLLAGKNKLHIAARRTDADELAEHRGDTDIIEFDLLVRETTHIEHDTLYIGGYRYDDEVNSGWVHIEVTDRIRFDTID